MNHQQPFKITIKGVHKTLGKKNVLRGIDLAIRTGETRVIIGQSGTGKSVLLKHITGLMHPDRGSVLIDDQCVSELSDRERAALMSKFGMLFQGAALFDSLTVGENIAFRQIQSRRYSAAEIARLVDEKLELVGLSGISRQKPAELSGGMQKRVGLARAIASNPEIILYDEPTTGLDPITADQINDLILHLQEVLKTTSIAVTHDMVSAYKIATELSMIYQGRVIETATPAQIKRSRNPYVKQFINGEGIGPITGYDTEEEEDDETQR